MMAMMVEHSDIILEYSMIYGLIVAGVLSLHNIVDRRR